MNILIPAAIVALARLLLIWLFSRGGQQDEATALTFYHAHPNGDFFTGRRARLWARGRQLAAQLHKQRSREDFNRRRYEGWRESVKEDRWNS